MIRKETCILAAGSILTAATLAAQPPLLDAGLERYWNGEYEATVTALEGRCAELASLGERIECFSYLGFSHVALGHEEPSRAAFVALLSMDPAYRLDAELFPPKILTRFEQAASQLAETRLEEAKGLYDEGAYASALERLDQVLLLSKGHEIAREYRKLCNERIELEAALARAKSEPEPAPAAVEAPSVEPSAPAPDENRVYHVDSEIERPVLTHRVDPEYPRAALARGIEGSVVVAVVIDAAGTIRESRIVRSVSETLDRAALDAVSQWRYRPATRNGVPVAVHSLIQLSFELES